MDWPNYSLAGHQHLMSGRWAVETVRIPDIVRIPEIAQFLEYGEGRLGFDIIKGKLNGKVENLERLSGARLDHHSTNIMKKRP